jgi:TolB protein
MRLFSIAFCIFAPSCLYAANAPVDLTLEATNHETRINQVAFSPDGTQLAFVANKTGAPKIWIMPASGGEPRILLPGRTSESLPQWSPDGTRIAFVSNQDGQPDIWVVSAKGGDSRRVTNDKLAKQGISWSPDPVHG